MTLMAISRYVGCIRSNAVMDIFLANISRLHLSRWNLTAPSSTAYRSILPSIVMPSGNTSSNGSFLMIMVPYIPAFILQKQLKHFILWMVIFFSESNHKIITCHENLHFGRVKGCYCSIQIIIIMISTERNEVYPLTNKKGVSSYISPQMSSYPAS